MPHVVEEQTTSVRENIWNLIEGDSAHSYRYGRVMSIVIIVSMLPLCFKEMTTPLLILEFICVVVFIVDYAMRWSTADFKLKRGKLSFLIYPFTPMAIIDLLTIIPVFAEINPAVKALRSLRLLRSLRAFKLIRYSRSITLITSVLNEQRDALIAVLALAGAYVLVAATLVFNIEPGTFPTFFDAVYWAVISLTTVGYGDLYPVSTAGRLISMVSALAGVAIVALPSGVIAAGVLEKLGDDRKAEEARTSQQEPDGEPCGKQAEDEGSDAGQQGCKDARA